MRALVLTLTAALVAGCAAAPPEDTTDAEAPPARPGPRVAHVPPVGDDDLTLAAGCLPSDTDVPGPSGSAPKRAAWRVPPEEAARRLAEAVDDPLVGEPERSGGSLRWNTTRGTMEAWLDAPHHASPALTYRTTGARVPTGDEAATAWLRGVLERYAGDDAEGLDVFHEPSAVAWAVRYGHHVEGRAVSGVGGWAERSHDVALYFGPAYDLPARVEVPLERAERTAEGYARCAMDQAGATEGNGYAMRGAQPGAQLAVRRDSLSHQVLVRFDEPPPGTHCGTSLWVHVDAVNGAILGHESPLCF